VAGWHQPGFFLYAADSIGPVGQVVVIIANAAKQGKMNEYLY
jgi:hypothetical protein